MAKEENIYRKLREGAGLTREKAGELLEWISPDRIDRIERGAEPRPDEIVRMAECYKRPELCNYYCSHICQIGKQWVPEVPQKELASIVLELLSNLNTLNRERDRLIEITADGVISADEYNDFGQIQRELEQVSVSANALKLWIQKTIAEGKLEKDALK